MKTRSRIILLLLALIIIFTGILYFFYENISNQREDKKESVIVILNSSVLNSEFWRSVRAGVDVAAREYNITVGLTTTSTESDVEEQIQKIKDVIKLKPSAIVLAPSDYNTIVPMAQQIKELGIKLITIDSNIDQNVADCFIGTNNLEAGNKIGKELKKIVVNDSNIVIIGSEKGSITAIEREKGVRQELSQKKIMDTLFCDNDQYKAYKLIKDLLTNNTDIKGIVALNDVAASGVARAVSEMGLKGQVKIVGFDSSNEIVKYLESGTIQATIVQNSFNIGYLGIKTCFECLKGKTVSSKIDVESQLVTKKNMYTRENQKLLFPFIEN